MDARRRLTKESMQARRKALAIESQNCAEAKSGRNELGNRRPTTTALAKLEQQEIEVGRWTGWITHVSADRLGSTLRGHEQRERGARGGRVAWFTRSGHRAAAAEQASAHPEGKQQRSSGSAHLTWPRRDDALGVSG